MRRLPFRPWLLLIAAGCEPGMATRDSSAGPTTVHAEVADSISREQAITRARELVVSSGMSRHVHLDSTAIEAVDSVWRVTFKRRVMMAPAMLTVDVNRRTGVVRFPGDE